MCERLWTAPRRRLRMPPVGHPRGPIASDQGRVSALPVAIQVWVMLMQDVNRRRFLQLAGGTVAATMLSDSIAKALTIPANRTTRSLEDVEHIVVLMQENRSFDHYFGVMRGVRGFGDPHPVVLPSGQPVWYQADGVDGRAAVPARRRQPRADLHRGSRPQLGRDPPDVQRRQLGSVAAGQDDDLHGAHGARGPAVPLRAGRRLHRLRRLPLLDARPDRPQPLLHVDRLGRQRRPGRRPGDRQRRARLRLADLPRAPAGRRRQLEDLPGRRRRPGRRRLLGLDLDDPYIGNYGDNSLLYFLNYQNAAPGSPLYQAARTGTDVNAGGGFFDILAADVQSGNLPSVSWIVAPEAYTEHPAWPAGYGAWYTAGVLNALTSDPDVWSKTALLITFDENDGFFDHVVAPVPQRRRPRRPVDRAARQRAVQRHGRHARAARAASSAPTALGVRVPLLAVSPWSTGGWVCSETFDHTSLIRFIEARFGVGEPNITPWRRAVFGDLTSAFDFASASDAVPPLPSVAAYKPTTARRRRPATTRSPPATGSVPTQEPGVRPSRRLGYRFDVALRRRRRRTSTSRCRTPASSASISRRGR